MINKIVTVFLYIIALILFLFIGITVIILSYLFKPRTYDRFVKWLCRFFVRSLFIRVKTIGTENFDHNKAYLFVSNHVNIFDLFILNGYIPNFARGVEQDKHFDWPIWGKVTARFGNIPISQTQFKSALKSLEKAEQAVREGTSIIIMPEGHRTRDGELLPFMRGPFMLALKTKADIVPMAMVGAFAVKKVTHRTIRPGKIKVVFGETILYENIKNLSSKELRDLVKDKIQKLIEAHSA